MKERKRATPDPVTVSSGPTRAEEPQTSALLPALVAGFHHGAPPDALPGVAQALGNRATGTVLRSVEVIQRHRVSPDKTSQEESEDERDLAADEEEAQIQRTIDPTADTTIQAMRTPRQWWKDRKKKKQEDSYNILMGGELPTMSGMAEKRMEQVVKYDEEEVAREKVRQLPNEILKVVGDESAMQSVVDRAMASYPKMIAPREPTMAPPPVEWVKGAADIVKRHVEAAIAEGKEVIGGTAESAMKKDIRETLDLEATPLELGSFISEVVKGVYEEAEGTAGRRAPLTADRRGESKYQYIPGYSASEAFLEERKTVKFEEEIVSKEDKPGFAAALKKMPTVAALIGGDYQPLQVQGEDAPDRPEWRDGGTLRERVKPAAENTYQSTEAIFKKRFKKIRDKRVNSDKIKDRIDEADAMVRTIVAPELLARVPRPKFMIHPGSNQISGFFTKGGFFRPYATEDEIHLAYDEASNVVAHEVAHVVENYIPIEAWADVHDLLGSRHEAAGGGKARAGATPLLTTFSEGRYAGDYTTGKYTSTAYKEGNAEVISMAFEFFAEPKKALKLVEKDPQHAALVLRIMKPDEYKGTPDLRPYDKYLPNKGEDDKSLLDRYREAQQKTDALFGIGR